MNNRLITARKGYIKPVWLQANLFDDGGDTKDEALVNKYVDALGEGKLAQLSGGLLGTAANAAYLNSTNAFGLSKANNPFSKVNMAGGLKTMASTSIGKGVLGAVGGLVGGAAFNGLSGGLSSGASNAINKIGGTIGGIVSNVNPVLGGIVSVGSGVIGGLTNKAFGSKLNYLNIGRIQNNTSNVLNTQFDSSSGLNLLASYNSSDKSLGFSLSDVGKDGWWSNKAKNKYNELKRQADYALLTLVGNLNLASLNLNNRQMANELYNLAAFGGYFDSVDPSTPIGYSLYTDKYILNSNKSNKGVNNIFGGTPNMFSFGGNVNTNSADWSTGLTHINTGKSHEENPNDGVQVGVDSLNVPNLVEEGEVIYDDYVFSNRLVVPRGMRGNYGKRNKYAKGGKLDKNNSEKQELSYEDKTLKLFEGLTFAEAAKKAERLSGINERPNDPIAKKGFEAMLAVLRDSQEREREKERLQKILESIDNMSPEELAAFQQQMLAYQQLLAQLEAQQEAMAELQLQQELQIQQPVELPVTQPQVMAALGGELSNRFDYGGSIGDFKRELALAGISPEEYYRQYLMWQGNDADTISLKLDEFNYNPDMFIEATFKENFINDYLKSIKDKQVLGPEGEAFLHYNKNHPDSPYTPEDWKSLDGKERNKYIKQYRNTLDKERKNDFNERLTKYRQLLENDRINAEYRKALRDSYIKLDDLKDFDYNTLERIAYEVNPKYLHRDISKLSDNDSKLAINDLRQDIVNWSKDNVTLGDLADRFNNSYNENWEKTVLADNDDALKEERNLQLNGWSKISGYNFNDFNNTLNAYTASMNVGNNEGYYTPDANFPFDEGIENVDQLQESEAYKNFTKAAIDVINANKDAKWKVENGRPVFDGKDADLLNAIYNLVSRTRIRNNNEDNVPLFKRNDDGTISFNKDITDEKYSAAKYYDYLRNDKELGVMHLSPKMLDIYSRTLYTVDGNNYHTLDLITAKTPNWEKYYNVSDAPDLDDGTKVKRLTLNPIVFNRLNSSSPELLEYKSQNDPMPAESTWPYLAAGLALLGVLGYNMLRPSDYSHADATIEAAKEAGKFTPVTFKPVGERLRYNPFDINYTANQLRASELANARNLINISNGNIGATLAGLLANNYNNQIALGNAYRQALEYNDALRKQTAEFNRETDKINSEGFLRADMANLDAESRANQYKLSGIQSGNTMKQAIDDARASAINAGINGLVNLAFTYGLQRDLNNLAKWRANRAIDGPGIGYGNSTAKGGRIIRRKRGLSF